MEAFQYLIYLIILITIIGFGIYALYEGISTKDNQLKYISLVFIGVPIIIILYNLFPNLLNHKPTDKEIVGTYKIVSAENGIPQSEFDKYTLNLKIDGTFNFVKTKDIALCETGNYELDYQIENNELSFQCGQGWTSEHIKRKIFGFEIEFFNSERPIRFEKME